MGSTGDPPVPVGDSPTGARLWATPQPQQLRKAKRPSLLPTGALPVPRAGATEGASQFLNTSTERFH